MGTEREFDALSSEAIAASEKEFFNDAMDAGDPVTDESGDRTLETTGDGLEGQHEADEEGNEEGAEAAEADPEGKPEGEDDAAKEARERDERGQFKPKGNDPAPKSETPAERGLRTELVGEREKRKAAETEFATYRESTERRMAALEARLTQAPQPQPQPQAQQEPAKAEIPDRWTDPEGYDRWHRDQIVLQVRQERVAGSFEEARAEHGAAFDEAYKAADGLPPAVAKPLLDRIMVSPNPARTLMAWHKQQKAMADIGSDPVAFRDRVAAETRESLMKDPEFRKQVLGEIQTEARGPGGSPARTAVNLPPSLSSARGAAPSRADLGDTSDRGLFEDAMR